METISACMIIKNEQVVIEDTIRELASYFDEIVVVDTGSTDDTLFILEKLRYELSMIRIKIHHYKWNNDFASARNYSFKWSTSDWTTWWDADDKLSSDLKSLLVDIRMGRYTHIDLINNCTITSRDRLGNPQSWIENERIIRTIYFDKWVYRIHEKLFHHYIDPDRQISFGPYDNPAPHVEVFRELHNDAHLKKYYQLIDEGYSFGTHDYFWMLIMMDSVGDYSRLDWWYSNFTYAKHVLNEEYNYTPMIEDYIRNNKTLSNLIKL